MRPHPRRLRRARRAHAASTIAWSIKTNAGQGACGQGRRAVSSHPLWAEHPSATRAAWSIAPLSGRPRTDAWTKTSAQHTLLAQRTGHLTTRATSPRPCYPDDYQIDQQAPQARPPYPARSQIDHHLSAPGSYGCRGRSNRRREHARGTLSPRRGPDGPHEKRGPASLRSPDKRQT